jgi:hypothetical protein
MAINVDTVYQRVLAILNKEQRGFLTPQKFNLYANQAQLDTLEQYFYDLDLQLAMPGNSTTHADSIDILESKIAKFETDGVVTFNSPNFILPGDCYRLSTLLLNGVEATSATRKEIRYILQSPIAHPSNSMPVYTQNSAGVKIYGAAPLTGADVGDIEVEYIKVPTDVVWGYTSVLGTPQYNASTSTNFELDPSEETDLVLQILRLAGLEVKDLSVYETASRENVIEVQQEVR